MAKKEIKLSSGDQVAIIGNLGLFHGDWELYIRWLKGYPKDSPRYNDIPCVEALAERDKEEDIQRSFLFDKIESLLLGFDVKKLNAVWEYCELLSSKKELERLKKSRTG